MSIERAATPWHLWVVGIVTLLWHSGGAVDYTMTQLRHEEYLQAAADQAGVSLQVILDYFTTFPAWADAAWAFGVWGGFFGSLLLLFRSRFALHAFAISLAGLAVSTIYQSTADMPAELNTAFTWIFTAIICAVLILLIIYSRAMAAKGVLS
ncbi:hypothetical protein [Aurantiacibacter sediminis]|uniref:Sugar transporter n=1 Tax=Aurantiacibacter sediminis TaxID=2793064 RepID=A0ABS0N657_9SPHN|nr:hypothetical protein [Aurantiacibacter sediminis]MBH5323247.1 hypothetical protein [Aurantiacibacter sediminis]